MRNILPLRTTATREAHGLPGPIIGSGSALLVRGKPLAKLWPGVFFRPRPPVFPASPAFRCRSAAAGRSILARRAEAASSFSAGVKSCRYRFSEAHGLPGPIIGLPRGALTGRNPPTQTLRRGVFFVSPAPFLSVRPLNLPRFARVPLPFGRGGALDPSGGRPEKGPSAPAVRTWARPVRPRVHGPRPPPRVPGRGGPHGKPHWNPHIVGKLTATRIYHAVSKASAEPGR